jgi:hypothetical protein
MLQAMLQAMLLALFLAALPAPAWATFTASVDRDQLAPGEALQLTLVSDGGAGAPDLTPLSKDFEIVGRASGSSVQIINGHMSSQRQLTLTLVPRHSGHVVVPALQWGSESAAPIDITVSAGGAAGQGGAGASNGGGGSADNGSGGGAPPVFLTTSIDPPQPYVQAAVTVKVRLYAAQPLYQASLDLPASSDVIVQRLGKDVQSEATRDGRSYQVIQRTYVLFPQHSGEVRLDGAQLDAQTIDPQSGIDPLFGQLFGRLGMPGGPGAARPLQLRGDTIVLQVRPRPPGLPDTDWLPAQQLSLTQRWEPANASAPAGQPLTRHLSLTAVGLAAGQLPDLSTLITLPPGLKVYPDQPKLEDDEQGGHIVGQRQQDIAVLAEQPGRYTLPALRLPWWDTTTQQRREAVLPAQTLVFGPATGAPAAPPAGTAASAGGPAAEGALGPSTAASAVDLGAGSAGPGLPNELAGLWRGSRTAALWVGLSAAFAVLWVATLLAWWLARRRSARRAADAAATAAKSAAPSSAMNAGASSGTSAGMPAAKSSATDKVRPGLGPAVRTTPAGSLAAARRAVLQACADNAPQLARDALLVWARRQWPQAPADAPGGLIALARRVEGTPLAPLLRELERACSTGEGWQGAALAQALPQAASTDRAAARQPGLPGLYGDPPH